jgi:hypothetical protein
VQAGQVIVADLHLRVAQQHVGFLAGQRQVGRADLGDPRSRAQPSDAKRRLVASGQHQPPAARHVISQHRQRGPALGIAQQVHVIQD